MRTLLEKAVVEALRVYMEKKGIQQNELAKRLGWSPADLNDTLRGRKSIGKNRQAFLEEKLGAAFSLKSFVPSSDNLIHLLLHTFPTISEGFLLHRAIAGEVQIIRTNSCKIDKI